MALLSKPLSEVSLAPWSEVILDFLDSASPWYQVTVIPCNGGNQSPTVGELDDCLGLEWKDLPHFHLLLQHQPDDFCFCLMDACLDAARTLIIQSCGDPTSAANTTESDDADGNNNDDKLTLLFLFQNETSNFTEFKMSKTTTTTRTTTTTTRLVTTTTNTPLQHLLGGKWGLTISASNQLEVCDTTLHGSYMLYLKYKISTF